MAELTSIGNKITADGSSGYLAEKGRYHLYVSKNCPFAHRARIGRVLKGLEDAITVDVVDPVMDEGGWRFSPDRPGCTADTINGKIYLKDIYLMSHPEYKGKFSVPVLFDKQTNKVVNSESDQIMRMFLTEFNEVSATQEESQLDLYPLEKREKINELNKWIVPDISGGVYGVAFASNQQVYEEKVKKVFDALNKAESILSHQRFLTGSELCESDIMLFVALIRFDVVYNPLFKCSKKRIKDYKNLWPYLCDVYNFGRISTTVNIDHILEGYYSAPKFTQFRGIIPVSPDLDFSQIAGRDQLKQ